jgi:hypothetical protein
MPWAAKTKRHDDEIVIGTTWVRTFGLEGATGTAYSIAGATGTAELNTQADGQGTTLATGTVALATDGTDGLFTVTFSAASTGALTPQRAYFAASLTESGGSVCTPVEGVLTVRRAVLP